MFAFMENIFIYLFTLFVDLAGNALDLPRNIEQFSVTQTERLSAFQQPSSQITTPSKHLKLGQAQLRTKGGPCIRTAQREWLNQKKIF